MSRHLLDRRHFLTLPLVWVLSPLARAGAVPEQRTAGYTAEVGLVYDLLTFRVDGTIEESVDREAGRYQVRVAGAGDGVTTRSEYTGARRAGRWWPHRSSSWFSILGRESRSEIAFDWERRSADYHFRGETFFLRRLRVVDDVVTIPEGRIVDDGISATLNFADGLWTPGPDHTLVTHVVRRRRRQGEGPDEVDPRARAELAALVLRPRTDAAGRTEALLDLSSFSSWARADRPARIVFGPARRPELIATPLILGSSVTIRMKAA
jgi:hypothetical protein